MTAIPPTGWSAIRGFNYHPSYTTSAFETWHDFDPATIDEELGRGKRYFPAFDTVRVWLSWDAFTRAPERFAARFEEFLAIAEGHGLRTVPILTNRWHDYGTDFGGVYLDHFLPGVSWVQSEGMWEPYLDAVVGAHADDARVLCWDLCNEPFSYAAPVDQIPPAMVEAELAWLTQLYEGCKRRGAAAPVGISIHSLHRLDGIRQIEPISDVLLIHPYGNEDGILDDYVRFAAEVGKPLLATETCWGADGDEERVGIVRGSLGALKERQIGWIVHVLHHSLASDAHRPELGSVDRPGFHFIEADGSLRPGHDVFNEY